MANKREPRGTREERIARATELIQKHPNWGKDRVNARIKREYGVGLQRIAVAHLKRDVLAPTLTVTQKRERTMISKGLLPSEAKTLSDYPLSAPAMAAYIKERRELIRNAEKDGIARASLNQQLRVDWKFYGYSKAGKTDFGKLFKDYAAKYAKFENIPLDKAIAAPKAVTFTREQIGIYRELRKHFFTKAEAEILAKGDTSVQAFGTAPWTDAMNARVKWVNEKLAQGWKWPNIWNELKNYYRKGTKRSPWDFIRENYIPKRKIAKKDFQEAMLRRRQRRATRIAHRRVQSHFGGSL